MDASFRSGDGLMTFGPDLKVRSWNAALEKLTGVAAADAVGRPCWEVVGGLDEAGGVICHAGCSQIRLAKQGWPIPSRTLRIRTDDGRTLVSMATIVASCDDDGPVCLHLFRNGSLEPDRPADETKLTPRQRQVLGLLADGVPAKTIAVRLGITEVTARNHIRGILVELGCHSQLEAVAEGRRRGLL
ncbi:MAG TPA: PAS and helix-turn-helix domain-containing protein [Gaiellaceae bacterium]|nr:PAS and helix-turn-helix domain-containing protein [Gaiellaceae bacterium]